MAKSEQKPEEAYAIKFQGVQRYVLGPLYPLQPSDEVVRIWVKQSDNPLPFTTELGPANVTFWGDSLLRKLIASLPLPKHHVEDFSRFFYGCLQRSPSDLSTCLDHRYLDYLALDLANVPTLETKEE